MAINHPLLLAVLSLSIICVGTPSVSALYSPIPTALTLIKDNQKSPSIIFFLPKERPQPGVGWEIATSSGDAELALAQHLVNIGAKEYVFIKIF
ncbi:MULTISPECIES: hypothetical protein [Nostoc]|uniref:Uncharacterized protein n=2 Tax=Nostoc TaxID=1177 RepID=A0ABR8IKC7_9NOSO|nr:MULTISPECIES: hypothetical protein [Nostoc]MBD2565526.1 hypothetical protein [Nostoc linckia FACHB-391]MBD2651266.1 hypothetical protein [Nostoc foliaceum FACHB-393]